MNAEAVLHEMGEKRRALLSNKEESHGEREKKKKITL